MDLRIWMPAGWSDRVISVPDVEEVTMEGIHDAWGWNTSPTEVLGGDPDYDPPYILEVYPRNRVSYSPPPLDFPVLVVECVRNQGVSEFVIESWSDLVEYVRLVQPLIVASEPACLRERRAMKAR